MTFWYLLGVFSKISDEHPRHFHTGVPPPGPNPSSQFPNAISPSAEGLTEGCHLTRDCYTDVSRLPSLLYTDAVYVEPSKDGESCDRKEIVPARGF